MKKNIPTYLSKVFSNEENRTTIAKHQLRTYTTYEKKFGATLWISKNRLKLELCVPLSKAHFGPGEFLFLKKQNNLYYNRSLECFDFSGCFRFLLCSTKRKKNSFSIHILLPKISANVVEKNTISAHYLLIHSYFVCLYFF